MARLTKAQRAKIDILTPIVTKWNKVHNDNWGIEPLLFEGMDYDEVQIICKPSAKSAHGCLITDIAGIANAFGWCWAIYNEENKGVHFSL